MTAIALWAAVVASYDEDGLIALTNIRDRSATTINTPVGQNAAQGVIDLWPAYAQTTYDAANALHVEVGKRACIALLWSRGGSSMSIAKVEWDEVFSADGLIARIKQTGSRGRARPTSNSGVMQKDEANMGQPVRGWSDADSLPINYLPLRRMARDD
jgi:hypothetical protein